MQPSALLRSPSDSVRAVQGSGKSSTSSQRKTPALLSKELKLPGYSDQLVRYLSEPAEQTYYNFIPELYRNYQEQQNLKRLENLCLYTTDQVEYVFVLEEVKIHQEQIRKLCDFAEQVEPVIRIKYRLTEQRTHNSLESALSPFKEDDRSISTRPSCMSPRATTNRGDCHVLPPLSVPLILPVSSPNPVPPSQPGTHVVIPAPPIDDCWDKDSEDTVVPARPKQNIYDGFDVESSDSDSEVTEESLQEYDDESYTTKCEETEALNSLNAAITNALAPDIKLAAAVITYFRKLPQNLRSFVYGIAGQSESTGNSSTSSSSVKAGKKSKAQGSVIPSLSSTKRRNGEDEEPDEEKPRKLRAKDFNRSRISVLKYACPFHIKYPDRYRVRNEIGSFGELYRSCVGIGWGQLRHLKGHLEDTHRPAQCQRCWMILDSAEELSDHILKMEPRCEDRSEFRENKEGIDDISWRKVVDILRKTKTGNRDGVSQKSDEEKWLDMFSIIFPPNMYPGDRVPTHPYYVDPLSYDETERKLTAMKGIHDEKAANAPGEERSSRQEGSYSMPHQASRPQTGAISATNIRMETSRTHNIETPQAACTNYPMLQGQGFAASGLQCYNSTGAFSIMGQESGSFQQVGVGTGNMHTYFPSTHRSYFDEAIGDFPQEDWVPPYNDEDLA